MEVRTKRILIALLTIVIMIIMIFIIDYKKLFSNIQEISIFGIILFALIYTLAFLFRAYKLKVIYNSLNLNVKYSTCYFTLGASFLINDLTLGKIGDVAKVFLIKDQENIRLGQSVAGIAIERILDFLTLLSISALSLVFLYFSSTNQQTIILGQNIEFYLIIGVLLLILILVGLILLLYKTEFIVNLVNKVSKRLANLIKRFLHNFKKGMREFKDNKKKLSYIVLLGFPTWIIDASAALVFFYFLGYSINFFVIIFAMLLSFLSKIIPITPGGWGISENIGALFIFIFYPTLPFIDILSLFVIDHLFRSFYLYFFGGYSIFHYNFKLKKLEELEDNEI
ncbi:MAG: flippase-like domain-containing protein [Promethearchaeota archaeon]|nr:MAG: flippase-like domain-containing protein [Candidatus Lokiarchaeota archaeon]